MLTVKTGGFNYAFCTTVCILYVFLYDTMMVVKEAFWWIEMYDKTYFIDVHLLVCYTLYDI